MPAARNVTEPGGKPQYSREVPFGKLMKGAVIIMLAPAMLLTVLVFYGFIDLQTAYYSALFIFVMSLIFVYPYIANLSALTHYVKELAHDRNAEAPDLTFLNNVEELSEAVGQLHHSWDRRRRQLEANIAESNILIDSLPDILIMLDKNLKILKVNRTARTTLGSKFSQETLESVLSHPEIRHAAERALEDREGRELPYFLPEPHLRHFIVRIERFPATSPSNIAVIVVMHDITRQKHTERVLSDFVANASHEIRTPLTSVIGFIETLQTTAKEDESERERFLAIMRSQADRMSRLVDALLSLSKIEQNIYTRPTEKVDVAPLLRAARAQMAERARERNITLKLTLKDRSLEVAGDVPELSRAFENLISNAIKYGRENSTVQITGMLAPNLYPEQKILREYDRLVSVSVQDEGDGIPEEHLPRLTERFYRVDTARSRKIGGTGLGLSIVKYILDRHRGALLVESAVGEGSTFTVLLPAIA